MLHFGEDRRSSAETAQASAVYELFECVPRAGDVGDLRLAERLDSYGLENEASWYHRVQVSAGGGSLALEAV